MRLIRFGDPGREKPGILLEDGRRVDVSTFGEDYCEVFFETDGMSRLEKWLAHKRDGSSPGGFQQLPEIDGSVRLGPPVCRPGKIVCIGFNYKDHARESGKPVPPEPVFFLKSPSALSGPNDDVRLPRTSRKTDWEVELAVVVKKKTAYVQKEKAMDSIACFVLFNDYSEREFQFDRGGQWVKGKSADTFAPLGPFLASPDEISDHTNLRMWLKVNGELRQKSNTSNMIFNLPTIISSVSQYMTLLPGDILCTGTPAGVGHGRKPPEYLKKGDVVEYGIDGLGSASQRVADYDDG
jgi:2-keto-4-pentenoate hydratase/2-oxohepta-3-ene-1,7-dioic acid hydratase in catechol pathway